MLGTKLKRPFKVEVVNTSLMSVEEGELKPGDTATITRRDTDGTYATDIPGTWGRVEGRKERQQKGQIIAYRRVGK